MKAGKIIIAIGVLLLVMSAGMQDTKTVRSQTCTEGQWIAGEWVEETCVNGAVKMENPEKKALSGWGFGLLAVGAIVALIQGGSSGGTGKGSSSNTGSNPFNSEHTRRPQKGKTDLEKVKRNRQKSEPGWVMMRGETYMHRTIETNDDGKIVEVGDGNRSAEFLIQDGEINGGTAIIEQKHGEEWANEAKTYLRSNVI